MGKGGRCFLVGGEGAPSFSGKGRGGLLCREQTVFHWCIGFHSVATHCCSAEMGGAMVVDLVDLVVYPLAVYEVLTRSETVGT